MDLIYKTEVPSTKSPLDYLQQYISGSKNIPRYAVDYYPDGMITDRLYDHLCRFEALAKQLSLTEPEMSDLIRIIWIHDLPEVKLGDIPAVNEATKLAQEKDEIAVAKEILNANDFSLYMRFTNAAEYLKGNSQTCADGPALTAKILDSIEGNMYLHHYIAKWIIDGNPPFEKIMDHALEYTFKQKEKYINAILKMEDKDLRQLLIDLLDYEIEYIRNLWKGYEDKIPTVIKNLIHNSN